MLATLPNLGPFLPSVSGGGAPHIRRLSRSHSPFHPLPVFENDLLRDASAERSWWPREANTLSQVTQKDIDEDKTGTQEKAMAPHSSTLAWKNPMDGGAW